MTNSEKKGMHIPVLLSFKSSSAILRGFSNGRIYFYSHTNNKCNIQVYLNMVMHTLFVWILLGFPLRLKTEKKYHSALINNISSYSVKRVDHTKIVRLKREQLVHLLNMLILAYTNHKI